MCIRDRYPQVQGFQKYGAPCLWKKKSACGNVPTSSGLPEIWGPFFWKKKRRLRQRSQPLRASKKSKNENSQNQNLFCPKCRQYFFMPEKGVPAPFGAIPGHFLCGPEKSKKCQNFAYFPWWALAAIHPRWGYWYVVKKLLQESHIVHCLTCHQLEGTGA